MEQFWREGLSSWEECESILEKEGFMEWSAPGSKKVARTRNEKRLKLPDLVVDLWSRLDDERRLKFPREFPDLDADLWSRLDDCVVEMIIARLHFNSLFQVSSLSKGWQATFRSEFFQNEVNSATRSWTSYAPVLFNSINDELMGYESSSKRWYRLPTDSSFPRLRTDSSFPPCLRYSTWAGNGSSLFCWKSFSKDGVQINVANPLTKTRKQLPPRPDKWREPIHVHLISNGTKAYKVILGLKHHYPHSVCEDLQIFDSTDGAWTKESCPFVRDEGWSEGWCGNTTAVVNGLYLVLGSHREKRRVPKYGLISFDMERKVWNEFCPIHQVFRKEDHKSPKLVKFSHVIWFQLLACGQNVMLVALSRKRNAKVYPIDKHFRLSVFWLAPNCGLALEVSTAPDEMTHLLFRAAVCDGDCIYFGYNPNHNLPDPKCNLPDYRPESNKDLNSVVYNTRTKEWHRFTFPPGRDLRVWWWTPIVYQPGWNPFLKV